MVVSKRGHRLFWSSLARRRWSGRRSAAFLAMVASLQRPAGASAPSFGAIDIDAFPLWQLWWREDLPLFPMVADNERWLRFPGQFGWVVDAAAPSRGFGITEHGGDNQPQNACRRHDSSNADLPRPAGRWDGHVHRESHCCGSPRCKTDGYLGRVRPGDGVPGGVPPLCRRWSRTVVPLGRRPPQPTGRWIHPGLRS